MTGLFRKGAWVLAFLLLGFLVSRPAVGTAEQVIRFGVLPVVDTLPLFVGQDRGFFKERGIRLDIIPFQSALERDAALQAGKLDGYFGDILNTLLLIRSQEALGIITTAFHTHPDYRMFALVSSPKSEIRHLSGLKEKHVALSRATVIEYLLDRLLGARDLTSDFVKKLEIKKMAIRVQMLLADQVPAALLPEPLVTLVESKGAHVLLDDRVLDTAVTVLALTRKTVALHKDVVPEFLGAYEKAVAVINRDPESCRDILLAKTSFPPVIKDQYPIPRFPAVGLPAPDDLESVQTWLIQNGLVDKRLPYEQVVLRARCP